MDTLKMNEDSIMTNWSLEKLEEKYQFLLKLEEEAPLSEYKEWLKDTIWEIMEEKKNEA